MEVNVVLAAHDAGFVGPRFQVVTGGILVNLFHTPLTTWSVRTEPRFNNKTYYAIL